MTVPPSDFREGVRAVVHERVGPVGDGAALVSGGLIDSMSIVDLILELEDRFGVKIPPGDVQPDDFDTIDRIVETVTRFS